MNISQPNTFAAETGIAQVFDHIEQEGPMWSGSGDRWARTAVHFETPFGATPSVQVALSMIDADAGANLRLELSTEDVTAKGFIAVAHTWSDTRIGRLRVSWSAFGSRSGEMPERWNV